MSDPDGPGMQLSTIVFVVLIFHAAAAYAGCKTICGRGGGTRWRREIVLHRNTSTGTRFGAPRTGKSSSSLVNRRRSLTRRRLPLLVLPASVLTGNEEGSLPSCWGLSMCHRRAQRASQIARTASGRYLSTGFCHERPFLLVKSHQPDST